MVTRNLDIADNQNSQYHWKIKARISNKKCVPTHSQKTLIDGNKIVQLLL